MTRLAKSLMLQHAFTVALFFLVDMREVYADPADRCLETFSSEDTAALASPELESCLTLLEASGRAEAQVLAGRLRIGKGDYALGEQDLIDSSAKGSQDGARLLTALRMAKFDVQYDRAWISASTLNGFDVTYVLAYQSLLRAAHQVHGEELSPLIADFVARFDPDERARSDAVKLLVKLSSMTNEVGQSAQYFLGRLIYDGPISSKLLSETDVADSLNSLLNSEPSQAPELMWWIGCSSGYSPIYEAVGVEVRGIAVRDLDAALLRKAAVKAADQIGLADQPEWMFRSILLDLEYPRELVAAITDHADVLKSLAAAGHSDARSYLDNSAVGQVLDQLATGSYVRASDLCHEPIRAVFDVHAALEWWSARVSELNCDAIQAVSDARRYLAKKGLVRQLPYVNADPAGAMQMCRRDLTSHYLDSFLSEQISGHHGDGERSD